MTTIRYTRELLFEVEATITLPDWFDKNIHYYDNYQGAITIYLKENDEELWESDDVEWSDLDVPDVVSEYLEEM